MKYLIAIFISVLSLANANAKEITLAIDDCGPLARGELGVVFRPKPRKQGWFYFAKGSAMEICPKLLNAKRVVGYEENYCKNYEPPDPKECGFIKVFVVTEYIND